MFKVTVVDDNHEIKQTKRGTVTEQLGYVHFPKAPFPVEIRLSLWGDRDSGVPAKPYPSGEYQIEPSSFYVGRFGSIECSPKLIPLVKKSTS